MNKELFEYNEIIKKLPVKIIMNSKIENDFIIKIDCSEFRNELNLYKTLLLKKTNSVDDAIKMTLSKLKLENDNLEKYFLKSSDSDEYLFMGSLLIENEIINKKLNENLPIILILKYDVNVEINRRKISLNIDTPKISLINNNNDGVIDFLKKKKLKEEEILQKIIELLKKLKEFEHNENIKLFIVEIYILIEKFEPLLKESENIDNEIKIKNIIEENEFGEKIIISEIFKLLSNLKLLIVDFNNNIKNDYNDIKILITEYYLIIQNIQKLCGIKKKKKGNPIIYIIL
jgi:hypothetical protein